MKIPLESMLRFVFMALLAAMMVGCGKSETIGMLNLRGTDTASFSFKVPSHSWPSRGISFSPTRKGESGMAAYHEPVYTSRISVTITNTGTEDFMIRHGGNYQTVEVGGAVELPEMVFRDFGMIVIPNEGHKADIDLTMKFDKAYRTSSWKLIASWSDGP